MPRALSNSHELLKAVSKLKKILSNLPPEAWKAFSYIWDNISVGEIIFERDLRKLHGIEDPRGLVQLLQDAGLVERGEGCFNLEKNLRRIRKKIGSSHELFKLLNSL